MKYFCLLLIVLSFLSYPARAFAVSTPVGSVQVNPPSQNNKDRDKETTVPVVITPIPTLPINQNGKRPTVTPASKNDTKPKVSPTAIPEPTKAPAVSRNTTTTNQQTNQSSGTSDKIVVPQNLNTARNSGTSTNSKPTNTKTTDPAETQTQQSVKATAAPTQSAVAKAKEIVAPTGVSDVQVKGINYYQEERLSPTVTTWLLYFALGLFMLGIAFLKIPVIVGAFIRARNKVFPQLNKQFTIPYINIK